MNSTLADYTFAPCRLLDGREWNEFPAVEAAS